MIHWRELFSDQPQPWLVLVCGLVGVGKSTIAQQISESLAAKYLSTDQTGYRLFGEARRYDEEYYRCTYESLLSEARQALLTPANIVLDGTFLKTATRKQFFQAFQRSSSLWTVYVTCDERVVRQRLENRLSDSLEARGYSDARFDVYQTMREKLLQDREYSEPPRDRTSLIAIDTTSHPWSILEKRVVLHPEVP